MKKTELLLLGLSTMLTGCGKQEDATVAMIGGADGPTAIFVAGEPPWFVIILGIIIVALAIARIVSYVNRKK